MKVRIILNGRGGQLDAAEITGDRRGSWSLNEEIHAVIAGWMLAPGDVIVIEGDEEACANL